MDWFPLEIFPTGGLASSVVTTVWIGVTVVAFMNLRYGTTLSGLVVPGYIVPLLLVKPGSAVVIVVESIITYLLTRAVADRLLVRFGLGEFFGRDRFFMLILMSVLVRVTFDAFLLVELDEFLLQRGVDYEFRSSLHSFGLIIIALSANQFWNSGLKRGVSTLMIHLAVTYAIVSFILIPLTNFNISTLGYMYEDVASNILASPKAYIILITAAFLASRLNLRYGWDFNGILIPSLLALQWYNPLKIATTFVEAFVILACAIGLLKLPMIRNQNIEGARQLLLFFNISFVYKLILGYIIVIWFPAQKITDLYGFGYLLATLLAIKMYQKNIAIKMTRTTVQTSLIAAIVASVIGFSLTLYNPVNDASAMQLSDLKEIQVSNESLASVVENSRQANFASYSMKRGVTISPLTLNQFHQTVSTIDTLGPSPSDRQLDQVAGLANEFGYEAIWVESRYIVLRDATPERGWGFYIFDLQQTNQLALQFPTVMDENITALAMLPLFNRLEAKYLAVASARSERAQDGSDQVLLNSQTLFQTFHQTLSPNNTLQVREYSPPLARLLLGEREATAITAEDTRMWVKDRPPMDLSLATLEELTGGYDIVWNTPDFQNRQRDVARYGFAELFLTRPAMLSILTQSAVNKPIDTVANEQQIAGYLLSFLQENKRLLAAKNTEKYVVPTQAELLYFDQTVLTPLFMTIERYGAPNWLEEAQPLINQVAQSAAQLGYQIILYKHISSGAEYFILREKVNADTNRLRHWGTYVFRLGASEPYVIEAPSPIFESGSFEFAGSLFQQMDASALLVSGAHPQANVDGSARVVARSNPLSLFNLMHQSTLRHHADMGVTAVQVRGYSATDEYADGGVKLSYYELHKPFATQQEQFLELRDYLENLLVSAGVGGAAGQVELAAANYTAQARFTKFIPSAQYAEIWLPRGLRESFRLVESESVLYQQFSALGIETQRHDVAQFLAEQQLATLPAKTLLTVKQMLNRFEQSQNIQVLATLRERFPALALELWQDNESLQSYIVLRNAEGKVVAVKNLTPLSVSTLEVSLQDAHVETFREFVRSRMQWLQLEVSE
ncbi:poly-gamma-glutamate biosynthesis protein PgsC/CapC [Pseudidiomarina sp. 1ASP75-14]|uniref:poly-gamma-glutamate biosynthesis protein PgsC/CapC n=1 Tax=Pseudidiomarina terrestris TaxID=2820060 RepID=UPI0026549074|nr:poly-gamma-glutamate biosynthesis protein PgsC/CapC [Pseudidiomarina sp. 1ASP75-14]MDN7138102.1 poly-gamma-glutamate biosynthesis protein PgsC/CapC [Pseudidiomarina sp. 1ASP75-14]